ncbi:MAG: ferrous iron transport protein A [Alphaproteobacteria bacterium]|nr:ferrous iron transport protein A [Alphaproteobacteria bacterium]
MKLSELKAGAIARVRTVVAGAAELEAKLREVGFSEGDEVEMLGHGPLGGRTLAVRLNRTIIALRAGEAALVEVELV